MSMRHADQGRRKVSRRTLLTGLGGGAAAGIVGAVALGSGRRRRLLHDVGLLDSPDHSVARSGTEVVEGSLPSPLMGRTVAYAMAVPSGPLAGVVYCLHGRGEDHRFAFDQIHLHDVAAAAGLRLAVVAVDGGISSYWHPRADGTDPLGMVVSELIPVVERRIAVTKRAVLGWSMGGYGALLAAERHPDLFRAVVAASPALWTSAAATAAGAFDSVDDYSRNSVFAGVHALDALSVHVDCGTDDSFAPAARAFAARLAHKPAGSFGPGFHDAAYWRSVAPAQIATIARAFA
jgi:S-formylglutathione hydrolase FrmB